MSILYIFIQADSGKRICNLDKKDNHSNSNPIGIFCSYASKDESLFNELKKHLSPLERQKTITIWHEGEGSPDEDLFREIERHFQQAHIILLLITSNFIGSSRCSAVMNMALQRYTTSNTRVIPIIMSNIDLEDAPFAHLALLPRDGIPVSDQSWSNRDEAFVDIVKGIRQCIKELQGSLSKQVRVQAHAPLTGSIHRQKLLKRMHSRVENLMQRSFGESHPATLRLREELSKEETFVLPDHTEIKTIYEAEEQLLIIGGPGSGKTTLLLQLAYSLLEDALNNKTNKIPIMLNLATWKKDLSFIEWLQNNLHKNYYIPDHEVVSLANANELILLLDGLDNIPDKDKRNACIKAINEYQKKHDHLVHMVITSRPLDRLEPTQPIQIFKTIVVEPLDAKQIDDYITYASEKPDILREELVRDPKLRELATTPLMLNIMAQVYVEPSIAIQQTENAEKQPLQQVFGAYVKRMLDRKSVFQHYQPLQIEKSLGWIAKQMVQHSQPTFLMKQIDENWLTDFSSYISITSTTSTIVKTLFGISFCLLPFTFLGILSGWFTIPIIIFASFIELVIFMGALLGRISWGFTAISVSLLISSVILITFGLLVSLIVSVVLTLCLFACTFMRIISRDTTIILSLFFLVVPIESLIATLFGKSFVVFLLISICVIFTISFITTLFTFCDSRYHSKLFFMNCAGFVLSVAGLFLLPSFSLFQSVPCQILLRITAGIFLFLEVDWLRRCMNCLILRWFLHQEGSIPWNYSRFLNSMVDCNILRKENQGYVFIHDLLRDYFSSSHIP